jgi:putative MFS transporter
VGDAGKTPLSGYQIRLFAFLSVATFFEGYDFLALTQILKNLRDDMSLSESEAGWLVAFINLGTVVAYLLVRKADRWGRKRVLTLTIIGYTMFTLLTGLSWDVYSFGAFQFGARVFLIAEWATAMVYAAEEFPADRRGMVIGVIQAFSSLGAIVCAGVVPLLLNVPIDNPLSGEPLGWRAVYFVGIIPLVLLAFARRNLAETRRFTESVKDRGHRAFAAIWKSPYRTRVIQLAIIWGVAYICSQNAITFWKDFAITERGLDDADVGASITIAALASMPLVFAVGPLMDRIGRLRGAAIVLGLGGIGVFLSYTLDGKWPLTAALILGVFGASAVPAVLNTFTTELFPTEFRGDAFAWANNLLGRIGYVLSPIAVGTLAQAHSWGGVLRYTAFANLVALALILLWLPETMNKELEETAAVK